MSDNRSHVDHLVEQLANSLSGCEAEIVIFGSAALALHGVDLGRAIDDLDLFVSEATFRSLATRHTTKEKDAKEGGTIPYITPVDGARIEILKSFPGVDFESVFARAILADDARGLRIGSLADLRKWKTAQGRPKDLADIEAIDRFLSTTQASKLC